MSRNLMLNVAHRQLLSIKSRLKTAPCHNGQLMTSTVEFHHYCAVQSNQLLTADHHFESLIPFNDLQPILSQFAVIHPLYHSPSFLNPYSVRHSATIEIRPINRSMRVPHLVSILDKISRDRERETYIGFSNRHHKGILSTSAIIKFQSQPTAYFIAGQLRKKRYEFFNHNMTIDFIPQSDCSFDEWRGISCWIELSNLSPSTKEEDIKALLEKQKQKKVQPPRAIHLHHHLLNHYPSRALIECATTKSASAFVDALRMTIDDEESSNRLWTQHIAPEMDNRRQELIGKCRIVSIDHLHDSVSSDDVRALCKGCGTVERVRMEYDNGYFSGTAHVRMSTTKEAAVLLHALHGVKSKHGLVLKTSMWTYLGSSYAVFIDPLPFVFNASYLWDLMIDHLDGRKPVDIVLSAEDRNRGKMNGMVVVFENANDIETCFDKIDGTELDDGVVLNCHCTQIVEPLNSYWKGRTPWIQILNLPLLNEGDILKEIEKCGITKDQIKTENVHLRYSNEVKGDDDDDDTVGFAFIDCKTPQNAVMIREKMHLMALRDNQLWVCYGPLQLGLVLRGPPTAKFNVCGRERVKQWQISREVALQGLHWSIDDQKLLEICDEIEKVKVKTCKVLRDQNGYSLGVGLVTFGTEQRAYRLYEALQDRIVHGLRITVWFARKSLVSEQKSEKRTAGWRMMGRKEGSGKGGGKIAALLKGRAPNSVKLKLSKPSAGWHQKFE